MARATIAPLLSINEWAKIFGINPWAFDQVGKNLPAKINHQCPHVWYQFPYQQDFISREELALAILRAEELIAGKVPFYPAPKYIEDEELQFGPARVGGRASMIDKYARLKRVPLQRQFVQVVGTLTFQALETDIGYTDIDLDNDGFDESFQIDIDLGQEYNLDEIELAYSAEYRNDVTVDDTWLIRVVDIQLLTGTTVRIRGDRSLLVDPRVQSQYVGDILDVNTVGLFMVEVDVYRRYFDTTSQGSAIWDKPVCEDPTLEVAEAPIIVNPADIEAGIVSVGISSAELPYSWSPDRLRLSYAAGIKKKNRRMDTMWGMAVAYLAASLLPSEKSGCERSNRILEYWRIAPSLGMSNARPLTVDEINLPWGPSRGARFAWDYVKGFAIDGIGI